MPRILGDCGQGVQCQCCSRRRRPSIVNHGCGELKRCLLSGALVADDVEPLICRWRVEICRDGFELCLRGPGSALRQMLGSFLKLTPAQRIRHVDEVQFMLRLGALEQLTEPRAL